MKRKEYLNGSEAREAMKQVAEYVGEHVGNTLGPAGRNYWIPEGITNDGRSIVSHIRFAEECKDNVVLAYHEMARRQDEDAGDGTTTCMVIGAELQKTLLPMVPDLDVPIPGAKNVMQLARELEAERNKAIKILEGKKRVVTTLEELEHVAMTSMENEEAAKVVASAVFEGGKDALLAIEQGFNGKVEKDVQPGLSMPLVVQTEAMFNTSHKQAVYENVPVLVVHHMFEEYKEIVPFMMSIMQLPKDKRPQALVIIARQYAVPFVQGVRTVTQKTGFPILLLSNYKEEYFEDIAAFADAQLLDTQPRTGRKIAEAHFGMCGELGKIVAAKELSLLLKGRGLHSVVMGANDAEMPTTRIQRYIQDLTVVMEQERDATKRKKIETRIAGLQGGITTLYVDAKTGVEKVYLKLKVEDAMNSCKSALNDGFVRGGGITLQEVANELGTDSLLYAALMKPHERIMANAGGILEIPETVVDSYTVAKAGIENAVSVVKTLITVEGIISDTPKSLVDDLQKVIEGK